MKLGNLKGSNTFRVLFIGFIILILLIPMGMVESVIFERGLLYQQANNEITASWGEELLISAPIISIPYMVTQTNEGIWAYETRYKHLRPQSLTLNVSVQTQMRYRSIYTVPVFTADVQFRGNFDLSDVELESFNTNEFEIDEAILQIPVSNPRTIKGRVSFLWDDEVIDLQPQWHGNNKDRVSLIAALPVALLDRGNSHQFEMNMSLAGSNEIGFVSTSPDTSINIDANWGSPGFFGIYLPASYVIEDDLFTANWEINNLLSGLAHEQSEWATMDWFVSEGRFGVRLVQLVNTYQQVTRSAKYAVLFISLTFLVYFFTEVLTRMSLHPLQYLLVGGALCLFYLLLLSLAEHIDFSLAYLLSATASVGLISLYSLSILNSRSRALIIFTLLSSLYSYLFVTLQSEAYALLIGSVGLFAILGLVMYLTRNIDWNKTDMDTSV